MAWFDVLSIFGARNTSSGVNEQVDKTNDSRNALHVKTELTQPTTPSDTQPVSAAALPLPGGAAIAANQQTDALTNTELRASAVPVSGAVTRTDGILALEVSDDMTSAETFRQALVASTDTTITFTQSVRLVRVKNESTSATVFVRDGAISSDTPANAEMVGVAPVANLPTTEYYPFKGTTLHLRSAGTPTVSVTGFY